MLHYIPDLGLIFLLEHMEATSKSGDLSRYLEEVFKDICASATPNIGKYYLLLLSLNVNASVYMKN